MVSRRVRTYQIPGKAPAIPGGPTGPEWTAAQAGVARYDPGVMGNDYDWTVVIDGAPQRVPPAFFDARWAGVEADGSTDDTSNFLTAITDHRFVSLPPGDIVLTPGFTFPDDLVIFGSGRGVTRLLKAGNGDFADVGSRVTLRDLTIIDEGTFTGHGLTLPNGTAAQSLENVEVFDMDDPCLYFELTGGSRFKAWGLEAYRRSAGTGTGRYAVVMDPAQQLAAYPKSFVGFQSHGTCAFDFGGSNNIYITASTMGDLAYTADSRAVLISSSRLLNDAALPFQGHGNAITGCDIYPVITVAAGTQSAAIQGNVHNQAPYVIDNANHPSNKIDMQMQAYTPTITSGGVAPSLGNGAITGWWSRSGTAITLAVDLSVGSTTSLGTGDLRFSLPSAVVSGAAAVQTGMGYATDDSAVTNYPLIGVVVNGTDYVSFRFAGAGPVTYNTPFIFATGDTIRLTMTYLI